VAERARSPDHCYPRVNGHADADLPEIVHAAHVCPLLALPGPATASPPESDDGEYDSNSISVNAPGRRKAFVKRSEKQWMGV